MPRWKIDVPILLLFLAVLVVFVFVFVFVFTRTGAVGRRNTHAQAAGQTG